VPTFRTLRIRLLAVLAAIGLIASAGAQQTDLTYLTHWPPETVANLQAAIDRYEAEHPDVSIEVRAVPFGNLLSTLRSQATSPSGPTIAGIYELWLPELVDAGIADPMPDPFDRDVNANWPEGLVGSVTVDGTSYGYPNEVNLYALNYNERLFAEAGIDGPPATWAELREAAEALTVRDGNLVVQQGFGLINSWPAGVVHPWLSLVYSNGGALIEDGEARLTSDPTQAVTELYHELIFDLGATDPAMGTANASTTGPYLQNFANGQTAMIIMANWWQSALRDSMGEAFEDVATAPIPVGPSGDVARPVSYAWLTMVNANADEAQREAAWAFLEWLNSPASGEQGASAMADILMAMGILPSRSSDVAAYADELDTEFLAGYVAQLENAIPFPTVRGGEEITTTVQTALEQMEFGQLGPQEAMETAQQEVQEVLDR
jgi:multiple sugar transport system substrate-binding protein